MAMATSSGKRRSLAQRIGTSGELAFRNFADRQGIIVLSKSEEDFGIDFISHVDLDPTSTGSSAVAAGLVATSVRSTAGSPARIRLTRADAQVLLTARSPIFLLLVHRRDEQDECYFRFVDVEFAQRLTVFLRGSGNRLSVTPNDCFAESQFRRHLLRALAPGYTEHVRLDLANRSLRNLVPDAGIQLVRDPSGDVTLVTTFNFFDYFDLLTDEAQEAAYNAAFGIPGLRAARLQALALKQGLLDNFEDLPKPYILAGFTAEEPRELVVDGPAGRARCTFLYTRGAGHYGYVHPSGVALTVSDRVRRDGQYVHETTVHLDADVEVLVSGLDRALVEFLGCCVHGSSISIVDSGWRMDVDYFHALLILHDYIAGAQQAATVTGWEESLAPLRDGLNREANVTVSFIGELAADPGRLNRLNFLVEIEGAPRDVDQLAREDATVVVPIVANTAIASVVIWLTTNATLYMDDDGALIGLRVAEGQKISLEQRDRASKHSVDPELILGGDAPVVVLSAPMSHAPAEPDFADLGVLRAT
jgi:hypothetical protein